MALFRYVILCTQILLKSLRTLNKSQLDKSRRLPVTMISVQKQSDSYKCGLFSLAFAADILGRLSMSTPILMSDACATI